MSYLKDLRKETAPTPSVSANPAHVESSQLGGWKDHVAADTGPITKKGYLFVGGTLGLFVVWASLFPISSAVVTNGKVISQGQNKLIQHPSGGVVKMISAVDGAQLQKGDLILEIEPAVATAELSRLKARHSLLKGQEVRLRSGKTGINEFINSAGELTLRGSGQSNVGISQEVTGALTPILNEQQDEFEAASERYKAELSAFENQLKQQTQEQDGLELQISQQFARVKLLRNQLTRMKPLVKSGYVAKARQWELEAQLLEVQSSTASLEARADGLLSSMDETRDRITTHKAQQKQENSKELSQVLAELAGVNDQLIAAKQALEFSSISAPVSGTLVKLQVHTIGGVVEAGAAIAEIVPDGQPLIVETRVNPIDIGEVKIGQDVEIAVTAFNRRIQDPLRGRISYVAADSSLDEMTGERYFIARAEFEEKPDSSFTLQAGMQSEVYINTGSRSFFSYLSAPVTDSIRKAFNEQ